VGATGIGGFYSSSIIIEFLMGMILARYKVPAHWIMAPLGFAALALLSEYSGPRAIILGLPALAVVAGSIAMESRIPKWQWFRLLGDASYAVYLFHMTVLAMLIATVPWFATGTYWLLPVTAILATTIGVVIHLMLEKPMLAQASKWLFPKRDQAPVGLAVSGVPS
jgi:peptidoglycan/LPS O-acetylase OafA/YrhL